MSYKPSLPRQTDNAIIGYTIGVEDANTIPNPLSFNPIATTLNGSTDYLYENPYWDPYREVGTDYGYWGTGITYSIWVYPKTAGTLRRVVTNHANSWMDITSSNKFYLDIWDPSGTIEVKEFLSTDSIFATTDTWYHVLVALDSNSTNCYIYINDAPVSGTWTVNLTNGTLLGNGAGSTNPQPFRIGASSFGSIGDKFTGDISEFWAAAEYIDISVEANRRRFINASGQAMYLGTDGSLASPTSRQPEYYLPTNLVGTTPEPDVGVFGTTQTPGEWTSGGGVSLSSTTNTPPHEILSGTLGTVLIPNLQTNSLKEFTADQSFQVRSAISGNGTCYYYITVTNGPYSVTLGSNVNAVGSLDLVNGNYLLTVSKFDSDTIIQFSGL